jgi:hypothetical protein
MRTTLIICLAAMSANSVFEALRPSSLPGWVSWVDWAFAALFAFCALSYFLRWDGAALTAALSQDEWQDVASAPINRAVLIYLPRLDYYGNGGVYAGMLVDMGTGRRWLTFGWAIGRDCEPDNQPTKWKPLPSPPLPTQEEG